MKMNRLFYVLFLEVTLNITAAKLPPFLKPPTNSASTNTTINPCDNFYEYCCTPWTTRNKKPPSEPIWNPWIVVSHEIKRRLTKILARHDPVLLKPQIFFKSCMDVTDREENYLDDLVSLVDGMGGWPLMKVKWEESSYDWLSHLAAITRTLGIHPMLKVHVDLDYVDPTRYVLYLEPGNLIFPEYVLVNSNYNVEIEAYEKWILESVRHLYRNRTNHVRDDAIKSIVKLEILLAKILDSNKLTNERMTAGLLSKKFSLDFLKLFNDVFKGSAEVTTNTTVVIKNYPYLKNLLILINKTGSKVVADYLTWTVIKDLSRDTTTHMRKLNFLIDQAILGVQDDLSREHECTNKIIEYFSPTLLPQYLKSYVKPQIFAMVRSMVTSIKSEFIDNLWKSGWLSDEAKRLSVDKVKNIKLNLGFPFWLLKKEPSHNIKITEDHFINILTLKKIKMAENLSRLGKKATLTLWPSSPFDVNAYYSLLQNSIFIPLGLLEPPFFDPHRPLVSNYGALGSLIGHELSHSLDPAGIQADYTGKITKWWPDEDLTRYETRIQCFKRNLMTGENIADSNGLKISLAASKKHDPARRTNKLFFISYAQIWCEIFDNGDIFTGDEHAPVSERVQNLNNIKDFRNTFECDVKESCELW